MDSDQRLPAHRSAACLNFTNGRSSQGSRPPISDQRPSAIASRRGRRSNAITSSVRGLPAAKAVFASIITIPQMMYPTREKTVCNDIKDFPVDTRDCIVHRSTS